MLRAACPIGHGAPARLATPAGCDSLQIRARAGALRPDPSSAGARSVNAHDGVLGNVIVCFQPECGEPRLVHSAVPLEIEPDHGFESGGSGSSEIFVEIIVVDFELEMLCDGIKGELSDELIVYLVRKVSHQLLFGYALLTHERFLRRALLGKLLFERS